LTGIAKGNIRKSLRKNRFTKRIRCFESVVGTIRKKFETVNLQNILFIILKTDCAFSAHDTGHLFEPQISFGAFTGRAFSAFPRQYQNYITHLDSN
jgi:hypothetical protein